MSLMTTKKQSATNTGEPLAAPPASSADFCETFVAIDLGPAQSALALWCLTHDHLKYHEYSDNDDIGAAISLAPFRPDGRPRIIVIEDFVAQGQPFSKIVRDSCVWLGRFMQLGFDMGLPVELASYATISKHLTGNPHSKDAQLRAVLNDRYGGKGTKKQPGGLYGVKDHLWNAVAVAAWYVDRQKQIPQNGANDL